MGHRSLGLVDVYAATIRTLKFVPGVHLNYAETSCAWRTACRAEGLSEGVRRLRRGDGGM